jgi:hypothetical protein
LVTLNFTLPETKGRTLEEIERSMRTRSQETPILDRCRTLRKKVGRLAIAKIRTFVALFACIFMWNYYSWQGSTSPPQNLALQAPRSTEEGRYPGQLLEILRQTSRIRRLQKPNSLFFGYWDSHSNNTVELDMASQICLWYKSIRAIYEEAEVYMFAKTGVLSETVQSTVGLNIVYFTDRQKLLEEITRGVLHVQLNDTAKYTLAEFSDIIRLALLYKYGGSWIDVDDILIRPLPSEMNILACHLWHNRSQVQYFGSKFHLVPASHFLGSDYTDMSFHVQNDPMINWRPQSRFLKLWFEQLSQNPPKDWGQKVPTDILRTVEARSSQIVPTIVPQYFLLLHPAFSSDGGRRKGPMFPPHDFRLGAGFPDFDSDLTPESFWSVVNATFGHYTYSLVKNSKTIGTRQCRSSMPNKWFIGHLVCAVEQAEHRQRLMSLQRPSEVEVKSTWTLGRGSFVLGSKLLWRMNDWVYFDRLGHIPYNSYNPSILKIRAKHLPLTVDAHDDDEIIVISWFVRAPKYRYGCMNWIGAVHISDFLRALRGQLVNFETFWLLEPTLLRNVLGPKLADARLLWLNISNAAKIGVIGYTRLAPYSDTSGIPDYYVRLAILESSMAAKTHSFTEECEFGLEEVGCWPGTLEKCATQRYFRDETQRPTARTNLSLHLNCSFGEHCKREVYPHVSRHPTVNHSLNLSGVEIYFSEDPSHTARKNVVPILPGKINSHLIAGFVDFSPGSASDPLLSLVQVDTGRVLMTKSLDGAHHCGIAGFRGSTQVVYVTKRHVYMKRVKESVRLTYPSHTDIWATIVHRRHRRSKQYEIRLVLLSGTSSEFSSDSGTQRVDVPTACLFSHKLNFDDLIRPRDFVFPTGLSIIEVDSRESRLQFRAIVSYGVSDKIAAFNELTVHVDFEGQLSARN